MLQQYDFWRPHNVETFVMLNGYNITSLRPTHLIFDFIYFKIVLKGKSNIYDQA